MHFWGTFALFSELVDIGWYNHAVIYSILCPCTECHNIRNTLQFIYIELRLSTGADLALVIYGKVNLMSALLRKCLNNSVFVIS